MSCVLEEAREIPFVLLLCFTLERCVAHTSFFVYGNYLYAELACGELGVFRESYGTSG